MVTGEMPKSSEGIPLLGRYVLYEFVISIAAVIVSVLIIFIHERVNYMSTPPPQWIIRTFGTYDVDTEIEDQSPAKASELVEELRYFIRLLRNYIEDQVILSFSTGYL
uniref:Neur_chan_memb domain-containing protein n=1 Tax=Heterorhabditis bacteriophora TaxID=37862 RepID=A0A1I7X0F1_HETBA